MKTGRSMNKEDWERGPWDNEPDFAHWIDEETSYVCSMRRNIYGTWNGYVGVDEDHPLFQVANNGMSEEFKYIDIHGGILSTDFGLENDILFAPPKKLWWISFACIHPNDLLPEMNRAPEEKVPKRKRKANKDATYKDFEFVRGQVQLLAQQLAFFDSRIA